MFFLSISSTASNTGDEKAILTPYTGKRCPSSRWIIFVAPRRLFSWYHRRSFEKRSTFRWWQTYVLAYCRWWWSYHDQSFLGIKLGKVVNPWDRSRFFSFEFALMSRHGRDSFASVCGLCPFPCFRFKNDLDSWNIRGNLVFWRSFFDFMHMSWVKT